MNNRELSEIKRRINPEKTNISEIHCIYVNGAKQVISQSAESVSLLTEDEKLKYFALLKKAIGGTLGKNLANLEFDTNVVATSDEHKLLNKLRTSELKDSESMDKLISVLSENIELDGNNYLILLAEDNYDVPRRGNDGEYSGDSEELFRYILCVVCPVKNGKSELGYDIDEKRFAFVSSGSTVCAPEFGFMYPAFDNRSTNLYGSLFYSKSAKDNHSELVNAIFNTESPMAPSTQNAAFSDAVSETLGNDGGFETAKNIQNQLIDIIEAHKESKNPETLKLDSHQLANVLLNSGVTTEEVKAFEARIASDFGENAEINPANLINTKKLEVATPEIKISVNPMFSDLVKTSTINGKKCIVISCETGCEVNGIPITLK